MDSLTRKKLDDAISVRFVGNPTAMGALVSRAVLLTQTPIAKKTSKGMGHLGGFPKDVSILSQKKRPRRDAKDKTMTEKLH